MSYCKGSHCVCHIVREVVEAQDEAENNRNDGCCSTSCEQSISDLLGPAQNNNNQSGHTTVPFVLYCESSCSPFFGSGVYPSADNNDTFFNCVKTPIFRAKNFINDGDCCVRLELLVPVTEGGDLIDAGDELCDYFQPNTITEFQATGICITVDLNSFNGIQCLSAITPIPSTEFPPAPVPQV